MKNNGTYDVNYVISHGFYESNYSINSYVLLNGVDPQIVNIIQAIIIHLMMTCKNLILITFFTYYDTNKQYKQIVYYSVDARGIFTYQTTPFLTTNSGDMVVSEYADLNIEEKWFMIDTRDTDESPYYQNVLYISNGSVDSSVESGHFIVLLLPNVFTNSADAKDQYINNSIKNEFNGKTLYTYYYYNDSVDLTYIVPIKETMESGNAMQMLKNIRS